MYIKRKIIKKIHSSLNVQYLDVVDESDKHVGHAGHDGLGESHFKIIIKSEDFIGLSRLKIHKKIYEILGTEIMNNIHALSIKVNS